MMKQGVLAHIYGQLPLAELAAKVSAGGFTSVQLALAKAISDIDTSNGRLSPGLANHIAEQFDRQNVRIAVLGCYIDPIHPDLSERRHGIERFKEHLRYARDFGCSMVATETGGYTTYQASEPERYAEVGWRILEETISELAEEADKWGVHMAIEPVADHTLHSTERMLQLIEDIPTTALGMLFDPCNMMKTEHVDHQEAFLRDTFEKLAHRMLLIHAKDFTFAPDGTKPYRTAGTGILDYPLFFRLLQEYKPHIDISLEGVPLDDLPQASLYMRQIWQDVQA
ncbi:sugar phosphate isomerase/epimerase [Paenibacillus sp. SORGH_AS306]|uniref:sugar phosphate isomerase/epimerase family protein n=1 Tax=unclassified Paenibacillus TaxID=185978 RepID=UPI00278171D4|nr:MULTISPECIES: sugar phosphate isomerase/epimerase [unclassified Paenibacillus]MDQ1235659.1 sugar phosphate isomerase/epimerase [Paenibacillus sp. SORGH_AS_0306]MDR6112708.1 sugar phosphate isomerase/epimerase [Paenibacillus sp. SORGH_AS_0338]